jgi:hypothetical protein
MELGVTATVLLSLIDRMKGDASTLSIRYSHFESYAYGVHGRIALKEGTEESTRRAVAYFENQLEVNKAIGNDEGIVNTKINIAYEQSMYEGGRNNEELLRASQELMNCVSLKLVMSMITQLMWVNVMHIDFEKPTAGRRQGNY